MPLSSFIKCSFISLVVLVAFISTPVSAQKKDKKKKMSVGFQLKPIFRNEFFNSGNEGEVQNGVEFNIEPRLGFAGGMVIRRDFGKQWAFETGINYVRRNYRLLVDDLDSTQEEKAIFSIVQYEIPFSLLIYVRLGENFYMNNSLGVSLNMFKRSEVGKSESFDYEFFRSTWIIPGLVANVGFEYRMKTAGAIYLGASYQLPFSKIITVEVDYYRDGETESFNKKMGLSYFTFDLKYFLPINKEK
ncbi:MAG TPA: hypothetical protein EYN38_04165 [Flavobacteriales bacterium]|nr:hypothetical protein [Flavobacteriales bacterium]